MENIDFEDPEDLGIGVWVVFVLRESHDMRPVLHVHPIFATPEVIGSVVDVHTVALFETVFGYIELVAVFLGERGWFGVILFIKDTSE